MLCARVVESSARVAATTGAGSQGQREHLLASRRYPGGVALRFARVRRYRLDKRAAEADTIERVHGMLA